MEDLIKALQIFLKYGNPDYPTNCSHDVLAVSIDKDLISEEDDAELIKLGFLVSEEYDGYISFKFGSC